LNTLTLYSLPTLSFLVSKDEEEENEQIPDKIFYWGILAVKAANKNQEDCPEDGSHLQRLT